MGKVANTGFHIIYPLTYDKNYSVGINSIVTCKVNISMILASRQNVRCLYYDVHCSELTKYVCKMSVKYDSGTNVWAQNWVEGHNRTV